MAPHILAVLIFVVMFVLIVMDKIERQYVSLGCGLLMIVLVFGLGMHSKDAIVETLNVKSIFQASFWYMAAEGEASSSGINWSTIIFILGMMIMVEGMGKAGFFRWLCLEIAKLVKYRTIPVFITFMLMSFVLAMFIDSITVILFLAAVTLELAHITLQGEYFQQNRTSKGVVVSGFKTTKGNFGRSMAEYFTFCLCCRMPMLAIRR